MLFPAAAAPSLSANSSFHTSVRSCRAVIENTIGRPLASWIRCIIANSPAGSGCNQSETISMKPRPPSATPCASPVSSASSARSVGV